MTGKASRVAVPYGPEHLTIVRPLQDPWYDVAKYWKPHNKKFTAAFPPAPVTIGQHVTFWFEVDLDDELCARALAAHPMPRTAVRDVVRSAAMFHYGHQLRDPEERAAVADVEMRVDGDVMTLAEIWARYDCDAWVAGVLA